MKVYFVGMHYKPDMQALDSRTYTGKQIDKVIEGLGCECVKTNLSSLDEKPDAEGANKEAYLWRFQHDESEGDVIVLLGKWVQRYFNRRKGVKYVDAVHPSAISARTNPDYVKELIEAIKIKIVAPKIPENPVTIEQLNELREWGG